MKCTLASARGFPPSESEGWTVHFIERGSRYWIEAKAGVKDDQLFASSVKKVWEWVKDGDGIRWFTDGERRYAQQLWKLASVYLRQDEYHPAFGHRKVWREGLEVAVKIKGSQGNRRVEWIKPEHPFTAISKPHEVHANHNEAQNAALRRRCSAYRRRQNLYAKKLAALQRVLDCQRMVHNWVRPHYSLGKGMTPAMKMGFCSRAISILELLTCRGFSTLLS
jgi:hypothetical protein